MMVRKRHSRNALSHLRGKHFPTNSQTLLYGCMRKETLLIHCSYGRSDQLSSKCLLGWERLFDCLSFLDRALEKPIVHRYKEIESFPQALNNSQKWNWSTRLFLTQARENITADAIAGVPSKWTSEELDALEKVLKEHESWLHDGVERQKKTKMNEDPVIDTKEMQQRAKTLEQHLQRLVRRKVPKVKKTPAKSGDANESSSTEPTPAPEDRQPGHDEL
jgi:hypothetical protein